MPLEEAAVAVTKSKVLQALTASALTLPGITANVVAKPVGNNTSVNLQYGHYAESGQRVAVDIFQGSSLYTLSETSQLQAGLVTDIWSGATPVLTLPDSVAHSKTGASGINGVNSNEPVVAGENPVQVMTGASMVETRYAFDLGASFFVNDVGVHSQFTRSEEPDYLSYGYNIGADWELNQKMTTLSLAFGQNFDQIEPTTRKLQEDKLDYRLLAGISQILTKQTLLQISTELTHSSGYLTNPYKKVFIQGLNDNTDLQNGGFNNVYYENRPDERNQWSISIGIIQYVPAFDGSTHLDYRYFRDDWGISSHTFEATYNQPIGSGWMLVPRIRYYSQTGADFFQYYYVTPRADGIYSSDFRLASFGNLSGGLKLIRDWKNVGQLAETISFEAGFEFTSHAADLKLSGNNDLNVTDFDYVLVNSNVNIRF